MLERRRVAPWPFDHSLGRGQLGNTDGIEAIFDVAGKAAGACRGNDPRIMPLAFGLADSSNAIAKGTRHDDAAPAPESFGRMMPRRPGFR
jgi:hypothetical protein